jgi:predicted ABC-type ATPase
LNQSTFTVIAGANGCGKSTLTRWAKAFFQQSAVLDPDAIAVELQAESNTELSDIEAGKEVIRSADRFLAAGVSFSVETTLSGGTYLRMLARAKVLGYRTRLFYRGTESVDINTSRIKTRVLKGGHDVPIEDQLRRYPRSFKNLQPAIRLTDECVLFDNSTDAGHRIVGLKLMGMEMLPIEPLPVCDKGHYHARKDSCEILLLILVIPFGGAAVSRLEGRADPI